MRRIAPFLASLAVVIAAVAYAGSNRFVLEDGTTGTVTATSNPGQVFNNGATTLVAHTCAANSCTRADPSGSLEGMQLGEVSAYRVYVCVSSGTLSGTGTLEAWVYDDGPGTWMPMPSKNLSVTASGKVCQAFPVETNSSRNGNWRLVYKSNAVATSAAAPTLTVGIRACLTTGCGAP